MISTKAADDRTSMERNIQRYEASENAIDISQDSELFNR